MRFLVMILLVFTVCVVSSAAASEVAANARSLKDSVGASGSSNMTRESWLELVKQSKKVQDLAGFINSLSKNCQQTLDKLMQELFDSCPGVLVRAGIDDEDSYRFNVRYRKRPDTSRYTVCMRIIPLIDEGIRVNVRKFLGEGWEEYTEESNGYVQVWWWKMINNDSGIDAVIQHFREECCAEEQ
ncbi:MAG: hypothetical protein OEV49_13110 [candidate division Zixibacteria bacterium]|nr:hypothetical protein [candidate division Zixibacteria bacterium]MDH3938526.1 hypothetical protein [candidate division Zixibacteria bacterium]MDH4033440.1 hypothetical protein [candidate division Zixibacteria bacterium]